MFSGRWRYATGYVRGFVSGLRESRSPCLPEIVSDDPDVLLQQAQQEMRENQAKNRERAVQAITAKNNLQAEVDKTQKIVTNLQEKADMARLFGQSEVASRLLTEKTAYEDTLAGMKASLASTTETVEKVKVAIRREEERIRAKTAQAMALKTQWKHHLISEEIERATSVDEESTLRLLRAEIKTLLTVVDQTDQDMQQQAERALQDGNRALARAILAERAAFRQALSA